MKNDGATRKPELNVIDKAIWAMADLQDGETKYEVYAVLAAFAASFALNMALIYRLFWKVFRVVDFSPPTEWWAVILGYLFLGVAPLYLITHSPSEIAAADLPKRSRRVYIALAFFIFPFSWGLFGFLLAWLE